MSGLKSVISFYFKGLFLIFTSGSYRTFTWLFLNNIVKKRYTEYGFTVNGNKMRTADISSFVWQYHEIFVNEFYRFTPSSPNPVIYDCGANIGTSVLFFSENYPTAKVVAYEASPYIYDILSENIKENKLSNVNAKNNAVWIKDDELEFSEEGADGGSLHSLSNTKKVKVKAVDFLEVLKAEEKIDMLKMDIEGAENDLIPHLEPVLHKIENLFVEYHSFNGEEQRLDDILVLFRKHNFRYYIRHANNRNTPFVEQSTNLEMDMQLNIFAYKLKAKVVK